MIIKGEKTMKEKICLSKIVPVFCINAVRAFFRHVDFERVGKDWIGKPRGTAAKWLKIRYEGLLPPEDGCICSVTVSKLITSDKGESYVIVLKDVPDKELSKDCPNFFLGYLGKRFNVEFLTGNPDGLFVDGFVAGAFQKAA